MSNYKTAIEITTRVSKAPVEDKGAVWNELFLFILDNFSAPVISDTTRSECRTMFSESNKDILITNLNNQYYSDSVFPLALVRYLCIYSVDDAKTMATPDMFMPFAKRYEEFLIGR